MPAPPIQGDSAFWAFGLELHRRGMPFRFSQCRRLTAVFMLKRRAAAIDSDEFLEFIERRQHHPPVDELPNPSKESQADITSAELAYWLSVFGDVKVADLADPPKAPANPSVAMNEPGPQPGPSRSTKRSKPDEGTGRTKVSPELFSDEWVAELQRWVDERQK